MRRYLLIVLMSFVLNSLINIQAQHSKQHISVINISDSIATMLTDTMGVEAYSDTTSASSVNSNTSDDWTSADSYVWNSDVQIQNFTDLMHYLGSLVAGDGGGILAIAITILLFLFFLSPFLLLAFVVWLIVRNRNLRLRLAQQARNQEKKNVDSLIQDDSNRDDVQRMRGIRNIFLGIGLAAFFACWNANFFAGLGLLLFFYGIGQLVIANISHKKDDINQNDHRV